MLQKRPSGYSSVACAMSAHWLICFELVGRRSSLFVFKKENIHGVEGNRPIVFARSGMVEAIWFGF